MHPQTRRLRTGIAVKSKAAPVRSGAAGISTEEKREDRQRHRESGRLRAGLLVGWLFGLLPDGRPARAEGRRAAAVASEQEQYARIEESRAKLVDAEAEVPKAMADSFRSGKLGILDYYKLRNVQADTNMRQAIAGTGMTAQTKA